MAWKDSSDDDVSVIGNKGEIGFIDYDNDKPQFDYNPEDEGPVIISIPFPSLGGKPQSILVGETKAEMITLCNPTSEPIELHAIRIFCSSPEDSYSLSLMEPPSAISGIEAIRAFLAVTALEDRVLQPGRTLKVWLSCKPKDMGLHTTVVHFDVGEERIERIVFLLAEDKISQSLSSNNPYSRAPRRKQSAVLTTTPFVKGSRPAHTRSQGSKHILPQYPIPKYVREVLQGNQLPEAITKGLTWQNYSTFFNTLLIMEELNQEEEMRGHDMENVTMRKLTQYLALEVPGLAERRPSLVQGDYVLVKLANGGSDDSPSYQGYIHKVEADEVFLKFDKDLHHYHSGRELYNISFSYNRVNMRRLYQAVQGAEKLGIDILFPSQNSKRRLIRPVIVSPLLRCLNEEQMLSVQMILGCKGGPPYLIHGPPGTGKTMTLVEAILQLYTTRNKSTILVCASSNAAADHVLEKLVNMEVVGLQETDVFRLNASSRPYTDVHSEKVKYCYYDEYESTFKCPPIKTLMRYRIIISTYMSASLLFVEGIRHNHFSHIFLDEAGQVSEPETMVPLSNFGRRETVIVLAGDPMQLGPVVYSRDAESYGLGRSYLERLFHCDLYISEDVNYVTKLVRNYRCHPAILELPSKLFYKGELMACKKEGIDSINAWRNLLPNSEFPVLFAGIQGCDEREGNNPSWFNRIEVSKAIEIIIKLRKDSCVKGEDIGVITPYRQQVMKLKKVLEEFDMPEIKVGSVEQFQGQERQVIIVSTVRSTVKHNEFDKLHYLGFLSNPRRFNVAVTRARSLLIIIGNPHIISKDPYWDQLLLHCSTNNSYQGCALPERKEEEGEEEDDDNDDDEDNEDSQLWNETDLAAKGKNWENEWENDQLKPVINESRSSYEWNDHQPNGDAYIKEEVTKSACKRIVSSESGHPNQLNMHQTCYENPYADASLDDGISRSSYQLEVTYEYGCLYEWNGYQRNCGFGNASTKERIAKVATDSSESFYKPAANSHWDSD